MADENETSADEGMSKAAAVGLAMHEASRDPGVAADAREFLRQQTIVLRLQAEDLRREDRLRHWSLRVRHTSDAMKLAFEFAAALIVLAIVAAVSAAVWSAAHDNSLVIEAFTVPPDMANRGLSGQAVASQLLDRLSAMQDATESARPANSYANDWGDDIKVQIPDTGVSVGEIYRILVRWLGHQMHVTGEVYRTTRGVAISLRATGASSTTIRGSEENFDQLMQQAADAIYVRTQPYRYSKYLEGLGRYSDSMAVVRKLAHGPSGERSWAFAQIANLNLLQGRYREGVDAATRALSFNPRLAIGYLNRAGGEEPLGRNEQALADLRAVQREIARDSAQNTVEDIQAWQPADLALIADYLGDRQTAAAQFAIAAAAPDYQHVASLSPAFRDYERALNRDLTGNAAAAASPPLARISDYASGIAFFPFVAWAAHAAAGNWGGALIDLDGAEFAARKQGAGGEIYMERWAWPLQAQALAALGRAADAERVANKTPLDCDLCLRARALAAASARDWPAADRWFAEATSAAPSLPFTYTDWGGVLLRKGDTDGAIEKFREANLKGPHFADPLEMWGEALMQKNRSDLALAKFEEANKYAPNWGRLHLEWGKALSYAGRNEAAKRQFAIASGLDLSQTDRVALAKWGTQK
jgi:hypothetical protein